MEVSYFIYTTNTINHLHLKWSSDRIVIIAKGFLKLPNLLILKDSIIFQKLGSHDSWRITNSLLNKHKSSTLYLFNGPEVLSFAPEKKKTKLPAEKFSNGFCPFPYLKGDWSFLCLEYKGGSLLFWIFKVKWVYNEGKPILKDDNPGATYSISDENS